MKKIINFILFTLMYHIVCGQIKSEKIGFNLSCFKSVNKSSKIIKSTPLIGYNCEFVFIPDVQVNSTKTGKIYYRDWWNFFIAKKGNYIDIYPVEEENNKAHVKINKLISVDHILYDGEIKIIHRKDFDIKYNTDEWQLDTISAKVKIIHNKTFKYNKEFITLISIQGWDLYIPKKCKTVEGYSLIYSSERGFIGSYVYFFSEKNSAEATSFLLLEIKNYSIL